MIKDFDFINIKENKIYGALHGLLPDILLMLSKEKLIYNNRKLVSSEKTFKHLSNSQIKALVSFLHNEPRSALLSGTAKANTRFCTLVPLFMSAHKEYNGVNYEDWDKTDPYIEVALGHKLWTDIEPYIKGYGFIDVKRKRALALKDTRGREVAKDAWPHHTITLDNGTKLKGGNLARHMIFQTWMANVEHRNKYMILDPVDWDKIPEPFDEVFVPESEPETEMKEPQRNLLAELWGSEYR